MCKKVALNKSKFVKGQVWMVEENSDVTRLLREDGSHVINGTRPYVIIKCNGNTCTCLPMTTNVTNDRQSENDILIGASPENGVMVPESRIVMSLTTKSNNFFTKYMYTFDEDAIGYIMASVNHYIFGGPEPVSNAEKELSKEEITEPIVEPKAEIPVKLEKKEIPTDMFDQCEYHLKHRHSRETLFRNPGEAAAWLNHWDGYTNKDISEHYGITASQVCNWKTIAKSVLAN